MIDTYRVAGPHAVEPNVQRGGTYFLPKHVLRVIVKETVKEVQGKPPEKKRTIAVVSDMVPDRRALAQVGFNLSAFSDDDIKVEYEPSGLLKGVAAVATDKTGDVIVQLAKTVSGFRATVAEQEAAVAIFEFDPFDPEQATFVNAQLAGFDGSCVEVELSPGFWSPGCGTRKHQTIGKVAKAEDIERIVTYPPSAPGIYYRRPVSHRVHVRENGKTKQYLSVDFANAAPIFRIDVERTAFVARKTTITFSQGVPTLVQVAKPSEGLAIAELPLSIAKAVISAPVEALTEHKKVQTARAELYTEEAKRIQAEQKLTSLGGTPRSGLRSGVGSFERGGSFERQASGPTITTADCREIGLTDPQDCATALGR